MKNSAKSFGFSDKVSSELVLKTLMGVSKVLEKNSNNVSVGVASYLQLEKSKKLLEKHEREKIKIVGQEYEKADYIYTNFMSEVDKKYNDKYKIPETYSKISTFKLDNILIYELFKKNR